MPKIIVIVVLMVGLFFSAAMQAATTGAPDNGTAVPEAVCPNAGYFSKLITSFCWSCTLPYNLAGFADNVPDGANHDAFCSCSDELGVPEGGISLGFWSPDHVLEVSVTPWCSPVFGGTLLQDDIEMMGKPSHPTKSSAKTTSFLHYNYFINPLFKMLGLFLLPDCDTSPGFFDLDLAYMSIVDVTYQNSALSFLFTPDAIPIANPVGRAICIADGTKTAITGKAGEEAWFCAGLDGPLYPLTGTIAGDNHFIRNTQLITSRAIAALHRRGIARTTYGKAAMCQPQYDPMVPKAQYKISMMYPSPEANPAAASASKPKLPGEDTSTSTGTGTGTETGTAEESDQNLQGSWDECCHPLGFPTMWWAAGRASPGEGKDAHAVYNIFRYTDCCVRLGQ